MAPQQDLGRPRAVISATTCSTTRSIGANGSLSAATSWPGSSTAYTAMPVPRSAWAIGWKFTALPPA